MVSDGIKHKGKREILNCKYPERFIKRKLATSDLGSPLGGRKRAVGIFGLCCCCIIISSTRTTGRRAKQQLRLGDVAPRIGSKARAADELLLIEVVERFATRDVSRVSAASRSRSLLPVGAERFATRGAGRFPKASRGVVVITPCLPYIC